MATALLAGALTTWATRDPGEDDPRELRAADTATSSTSLSTGGTSSAAPTPSSTAPDGGVGTTRTTEARAIPTREVPTPPTRITVPRLDATLRVTPVGVDARGDMVIPDDPRVAGWYRFGSGPGGASGATVIAAHVDDAERGVGPLARLGSLQRGDPVTVTAGGTEQRYRVTRVLRLGKGDLDTEALFDRTGAPRLHLVTCGGAFDRTTGHYEDNIVVVATPVG